MADENVTTTETNVTENQNTAESNNPSVEELMAQLATAKADAEKYKSANDKLSKSEAEIRKQLRAQQTAEEQEAEAKAEAQRLADEERESMRKELNHMKAVAAYKDVSDEKVVEKLIDAVSDADHAAIASIIAEESKKAVASEEAKWLKDRPSVRSGQYFGMTREQIMAIADSEERIKAIAMNKELFR